MLKDVMLRFESENEDEINEKTDNHGAKVKNAQRAPNELEIIDFIQKLQEIKEIKENQVQVFSQKGDFETLDEDPISNSFISFTQLPQSIFSTIEERVSLPRSKKMQEIIEKRLREGGYSKNIEDYSEFFITMLDETIKPINEMLEIEESLGLSNNLLDGSDFLNNSNGSNLSNNSIAHSSSSLNGNSVILNNSSSNLTTSSSLKNSIDTIDKSSHLKSSNSSTNKRNKSHREGINESSNNINDRDASLRKNLIAKLVASKVIQTEVGVISSQPDCIFEQTPISDELTRFFLEKLMANENLARLMCNESLSRHVTQSRCITFLPCTITYVNNDIRTITLVSLSGLIKKEEKSSPLYELYEALKSFSTNLQHDKSTFEFIEHAASKFDWLLHEGNRAITSKGLLGKDETTVLPLLPLQPCAEKKVYAELAKHLMNKKAKKIISIKILGETNVYVPKPNDWQNPSTSGNFAVTETNGHKTKLQELETSLCEATELDREKRECASWFFNFIEDVQSNKDYNFNDREGVWENSDTVNSLKEKFKKISNDKDELIKKDIAALSKLISPIISSTFQKKCHESSKLVLPKGSELLQNKMHFIKSPKLLNSKEEIRNKEASASSLRAYLDNKMKEEALPIFSIPSTFSKLEMEGKKETNYYPFRSCLPCDHCQKQKMSYLTVLFHAADIDFKYVKTELYYQANWKDSTNLSINNLSQSAELTYKFDICKLEYLKNRNLRLSDPRCDFSIKNSLK